MPKHEAQLFEAAIIKQGKTNRDGDVTEEPQLLKEPWYIFAKDLDQANLIAARAIPEDELGNLERITLAVRPF